MLACLQAAKSACHIFIECWWKTQDPWIKDEVTFIIYRNNRDRISAILFWFSKTHLLQNDLEGPYDAWALYGVSL